MATQCLDIHAGFAVQLRIKAGPWTECTRWSLTMWDNNAGWGIACFEEVQLVCCIVVPVLRVQGTLKSSPAWLIQDYTGRRCVPFPRLSAFLPVMLQECMPWNQLSSFCCITAHLMVHSIGVTSLIRDFTWHAVQLWFGRNFWASVKMWCDGFLSDPPGALCKVNWRSLKGIELTCGWYFSFTTHWKSPECIPLFVNHDCEYEQSFISKAKCLKLFTFYVAVKQNWLCFCG